MKPASFNCLPPHLPPSTPKLFHTEVARKPKTSEWGDFVNIIATLQGSNAGGTFWTWCWFHSPNAEIVKTTLNVWAWQVETFHESYILFQPSGEWRYPDQISPGYMSSFVFVPTDSTAPRLKRDEHTVFTGHLQVREDPQKVVHLIGTLFGLDDAVWCWISGVDVNHI